MTETLPIGDPMFWRRPLQARMDDFAVLREQGPFTRSESYNFLSDGMDEFLAVTRMADVMEISRRPLDFCSGQGSTAISDMPAEAAEFFGSFIVMDDPRHARQRGIVAKSFTPRRLQGVLDSVERICTEVIDDMCEQGEVDLVQAVSQPFPLLIICDMMGIPRSEFQTVLDATNIILGAGDPDFVGEAPLIETLLGAGLELTALMTELAEHRRSNPAGDLTTALVNAKADEDMLDPGELGAFFILLAVAGNDTTRNGISIGMDLLARNPDQRRIWADDLDGVSATAVEEIVRMASPVTFMRRTVTHDLAFNGEDLSEGDRMILFYGAANRDPRAFEDPERFDVLRDPNPHVGFGGPGPHFCLGAHLARRELGVMFRQLLGRLPDIEVADDPVYLEALGVPLVGGIKHLPVRFTPTKRLQPA